MQTGPWVTDNWWTSSFNHLPEVRDLLTLPSQVRIHDATLRDGEQTPGVVLRKAEKLEIARLLDAIGVDRIEAGMPAVSAEDAEAVKAIAEARLRAKVAVFSRAMIKDIDLALKYGAEAVIIEVPSGYPRLKYQFQWEPERVIERSVEAVRYAKDQGLEVIYFPYDTTRAEITFLDTLLKTVCDEAKPDSVAVVDTVGCVLPWGMSWLIKHVKSIVDVPVEVHTHNDLGLAVANTLVAVGAGAEVVHVCVNGLGERCGNAALEEVVIGLRTLYDLPLRLDFGRLSEISEVVQKLTQVRIPPNKPIIGEYALGRESGLGMDMIKKSPLTIFPYLPDFVGRRPNVVIGKKSGILSIEMKLEQLNLEADEEEMREMLAMVKQEAIQNKRALGDDEFLRIFEEVVGE